MAKVNSCYNCRHYLVHYVKTEYGFIDTACGHCTETRKISLPRSKICEKWDKLENAIPEYELLLDSRILYLEKLIQKIQSVIEVLKDLYGEKE